MQITIKNPQTTREYGYTVHFIKLWLGRQAQVIYSFHKNYHSPDNLLLVFMIISISIIS